MKIDKLCGDSGNEGGKDTKEPWREKSRRPSKESKSKSKEGSDGERNTRRPSKESKITSKEGSDLGKLTGSFTSLWNTASFSWEADGINNLWLVQSIALQLHQHLWCLSRRRWYWLNKPNQYQIHINRTPAESSVQSFLGYYTALRSIFLLENKEYVCLSVDQWGKKVVTGGCHYTCPGDVRQLYLDFNTSQYISTPKEMLEKGQNSLSIWRSCPVVLPTDFSYGFPVNTLWQTLRQTKHCLSGTHR